MRTKQIPRTKNKLKGEQNKITKYYGTQFDKLMSEQNKITKRYGTQLDYVIYSSSSAKKLKLSNYTGKGDNLNV